MPPDGPLAEVAAAAAAGSVDVAGDARGGWLRPDWPARGVGACMTTRAGGRSEGPWRSMNLGAAVGDDPVHVAENRAILAAATGAAPAWLRQVHGARVVHVGAGDAAPGARPPDADASWTAEPGVACTVLVADCLPVLFAAPGGRAVGAAHAGWRGLAAGVVEATARAVAEAARCDGSQLVAWLGACIGPDAFEVGPEVRAAFGADRDAAVAGCFRAGRDDRWHADLRGLARLRLAAAGVTQVTASDACAHADASRFFSFRRDGVTGRMAAAVWIDRRR